MVKCKDTRKRIMDVAEHLIMSRGFNGFSYKNISTDLNVKNAAIHYHFSSKKDLGVAVIRRGQARFRKWNGMISNQDISPEDKAFLILSSLQGALQIARVSDKNFFYRIVDRIKTELGT